MNTLKIAFLLLAASIFSNGIAQDSNELNFEFDFARFKYDATASYVDIYYAIQQEDLKRRTVDDTNFVEAFIKISIKDTSSQKYFVNKKYKVNTTVGKMENQLEEQNLIGIISYALPFGSYQLDITAIDAYDTSKSKSYTEILDIKRYKEESLSISDIQLSSKILPDSRNKNSIFYKNTMEVFPHPKGVYGQNYPMVFYYAELYNLKTSGIKPPVSMLKEVYNNYGKKVYNRRKNVNLENNSIVEVGSINITNYPTGAYRLVLKLFKENSERMYVSSKKFYVFNPNVEDTMQAAIESNPMLASEFGAMGEQECDKLFEVSEYIASNDEISRYESLDSLDAKRQFLHDFWRKRDRIPETPVNEFKREYLSRLEHVNNKYGTIKREGYETDRGRVYMVYGEPDEIDMHPNDPNTKPYEVWYYNRIEGGVQFVFGDLMGISDYELLHSTKRGEIRDEFWQRRIRQN